MIKEIIKEIEAHYSEICESDDSFPDETELKFFNEDRVGSYHSVMYVPQETNYSQALKKITKDDIVCDMGAGDLRFALEASQKCKKVYAVELNPNTLGDALKIIGYRIPRNLLPMCADWRYFPIPDDVTVITCLVNIDPIWFPGFWSKNGVRVLHGTTWFNKVERVDFDKLTSEVKEK